MQELLLSKKLEPAAESDSLAVEKEWPSVTAAIPAYNEEKHVDRLLSSFLYSSYPNIVEVLIADGE